MSSINFRELPLITFEEGHDFGREPQKFEGNLLIRGDVRNCIVAATGHITIQGIVQQAKVRSEFGSVFLSTNACDGAGVYAGQNIYAHDLIDTVAKADVDIVVESSVTSSRLNAGRFIFVESSGSFLTKSRLTAKNGMILSIINQGIISNDEDRDVDSGVKLFIKNEKGSIRFQSLFPPVQIDIGGYQRMFTIRQKDSVALVEEEHIILQKVSQKTKRKR